MQHSRQPLWATTAPRCPVPCPPYGLVQMQFNLFVARGALFSFLSLHSSALLVGLFRSFSILQIFVIPFRFLVSARQRLPSLVGRQGYPTAMYLSGFAKFA